MQPFALLGPSLGMASGFWAAVARLHKPLLAWCVDSPADLHQALEAGAATVISNHPLALRDVLLDWRDRCGERQARRRRRQ